jgi:site-specific recombinase
VNMFELLERVDPQSADLDLLVALFDELRPARVSDSAQAISNIRALCRYVVDNPESGRKLRNHVLHVLAERRHTSLFTDIGILSNDGFFTELLRRITYRVLPPALGDVYLSDALDKILHRKSDHLWIRGIPTVEWLDLFDALTSEETAEKSVEASTRDDLRIDDGHTALAGMLEAIRTLSYRISAIGLEPKLIRIQPDIEKHESPFLEQNLEVNAYLNDYTCMLAGGQEEHRDSKHLEVMLEQCDDIVAKIRKNAVNQGTTIALTYLLLVATQNIDRLRKLLYLVELHPKVTSSEEASFVDDTASEEPMAAIAPHRSAAVAMVLELVEGHSKKYAVGELISDNIDLLARNVTENASRTGEHYIAENKADTWAMFFSSVGAGFVIGFMAMLKILASYLRAAPLVEAFLYSLNYSFGFMLIHVLHFTVATKQPAMTASRIALGLHSKDGRNIDLESMADLIIKVVRTQIVAVLGNLVTVIPTAYLIAVVYAAIVGENLVTPEKAHHLLHDIDPFGSLALFQAMIAGVCLFLAGLISGYYDNKALYSRMAVRVSQLRGLKRLIGQARLDRLGLYIEDNLGGLMGNFYFGILLGSIGTVGNMIGLPIDIRHITFSSANFATALVALNNHMSWQVVLTSICGILGIGMMNLLVSFGLALWVALRSRHVRFEHGFRLLGILGKKLTTRSDDSAAISNL